MMNRFTPTFLMLAIYGALVLACDDSSSSEERNPFRIIVFVDHTNTIFDKNYWREHLITLIEQEFTVPGMGICAWRSNSDYCKDIVEIRSIHANTGLDPEWLYWEFGGEGVSEFDREDNRPQTLSRWERFKARVLDSEWNVPRHVRQKTDVFSAFGQIANSEIMIASSGTDSETDRMVLFYSDMIHDASSPDLRRQSSDFPKKLDDSAIQALAQKRAQSDAMRFGVENFADVGVRVVLPYNPVVGGGPYDGHGEYLDNMKDFWRVYCSVIGMEKFIWR